MVISHTGLECAHPVVPPGGAPVYKGRPTIAKVTAKTCIIVKKKKKKNSA